MPVCQATGRLCSMPSHTYTHTSEENRYMRLLCLIISSILLHTFGFDRSHRVRACGCVCLCVCGPSQLHAIHHHIAMESALPVGTRTRHRHAYFISQACTTNRLPTQKQQHTHKKLTKNTLSIILRSTKTTPHIANFPMVISANALHCKRGGFRTAATC